MTQVAAELGPTTDATIVNSRRVTPAEVDEVREITLQVQDPSFRFVEGQTIEVVVPGPHPFGNKYHKRRYSIASARPKDGSDSVEFSLLVRRCFSIDEISGESYPGIASNYLCDAQPGANITLTGPYTTPFSVPKDSSSNLLMIGTGTGIAPFRGFVQRIYEQHGEWQGQVRLFYGARTGMDLLYKNDPQDDMANFYDQATFKAFKALAQRPFSAGTAALQRSLEANADEVWELVQQPNTYVYLAGLDKIAAAFDATMIKMAGSAERWQAVKQRLMADQRWAELTYS